MRYCSKCGNELPDGVLFCNKCGSKIEYEDNQASNITADFSRDGDLNRQSDSFAAEAAGKASDIDQQSQPYDAMASQEESRSSGEEPQKANILKELGALKSNKKVKIIAIIAGGIVLVLLILAIISTAVRSLKNKKAEEELDEIETIEDVEDSYEEEDPAETLGSSDKVELTKIDPFEGVEVVFSGTAPDGRASVETGSYGKYDLQYMLDKSDGLSNGDTVTVTVTTYYGDDVETYLRENYSVTPSTLEKTYTVEGLAKYVTSLGEIPDELMERMKKQAEDTFNGEVAHWYTRDEKDGYKKFNVDSFSYIGDYLLTEKPTHTVWYHNMLTLLYKPVISADIVLNGHLDYHEKDIYYWYVTYKDILIDQEGKVTVDMEKYDKCSHGLGKETGVGYLGYDYYELNGYESLDDIYLEIVSKNLENYNHEDNINDIPDDDLLAGVENSEVTASSENRVYILPDSDSVYLSKDDLKDLTEEELKIARNEIYARHGRKFNDSDLQEYFDSKAWYSAKIEADDFDEEKMLNDYEIANRDLIVEYEKEH